MSKCCFNTGNLSRYAYTKDYVLSIIFTIILFFVYKRVEINRKFFNLLTIAT